MRRQRQFYHETYRMLGCLRTWSYMLAASFILVMLFAPFTAAAQPVESEIDHPSMAWERICLSMRVLSMEARKEPLRKEVESLAGIGWLEGFVIDPDNRDVILIGRRTPKRPTLHMDDLVVNMRNVWNREPDPYCSLDPRHEDVRKLNQLASQAGIVTSVDQMYRFFNRLKEAWGPQSVVVGGVPRNSRNENVMIDADYHMKKVSQGLVQLPGIRSCLDIVLDEAKRQVAYTGQIPPLGMSMSRFWFHVGNGEPIYQESEQIVCLDRCSVVVLTEKQLSTVDGTLYDAVEDDPHANAFAQELSERFQKAATLVPEYAELENLFRLSAVLRAMRFRDAADRARFDLGFFLKNYKYQSETTMLPSLTGLANSKEVQGQVKQGGFLYQYVLFPIACGGVSMEITIDERRFAQTKSKQLDQLREAVIGSRPSPGTLFWPLSLDSK